MVRHQQAEDQVPEGQKAYSMTSPIKQEHFANCMAWWGGSNREGREERDQAWRVPITTIQERNYNLDLKNPHTVAEDHVDPEELLAKPHGAEQQAAMLRDPLKAILTEALLR